MENENMEQEESILTLTDENGQDMDFEYLDCLTYEGKEYLVLMPADEPSTEIVILEVEPVDEENENYLAVEDEASGDAVFGLFKENYTPIRTFEEDYKPPGRGSAARPEKSSRFWAAFSSLRCSHRDVPYHFPCQNQPRRSRHEGRAAGDLALAKGGGFRLPAGGGKGLLFGIDNL